MTNPISQSRPRTHPIRWKLEAAAGSSTIGVLRCLPESAALELGAGFGRRFSRVDSHLRRLAIANLELVFPEWNDAQRMEFVAQNFSELGRNAAEWARLPWLSDRAVLDRVEFRGLEHLRDALLKGRGVFVATAHYGYWELILRALGVALTENEITAIGRTQPNPHLQRLVERRRSLGGASPLRQDAREILRALRRNAAVGVLADHYLSRRRGGLLVPFLARNAWSNPGPATLALRTGSPVLVAHARRIDESHHRIEISSELPAPDGPDRAEDIAAFTSRINDALGRIILDRPEDWLWANHRWKASPDVPGHLYARRRRRRTH